MKRLILAASIAALVFTTPAFAQLGVGARLGADVNIGRHIGVDANANANASVNAQRERDRRDYDRRHHRHHDRDRDDFRANGYLAAQSRLNTRHHHVYGESETRGSAGWRHW